MKARNPANSVILSALDGYFRYSGSMFLFDSLRRRKRKNRCAFVFYATDDTYAVAVLVFIHLLRELGMRPDADVIVLHLPLSPGIMVKMDQMGITTRLVVPLHMVKRSEYRHCLQKLRILELVEYDRVLFVDADSIPLKPLDFLLSQELPKPLAAPSAYWLEQPFWTTALLVASPSLERWSRVNRHFEAAYRRDQYDMDIINCEFGNDIHTLPQNVFSLNSEWENMSRPGWFANPTEAYSNVAVVHFSALGKPWQYSTNEVRTLRPDAHPAFYAMWEKWRSTRDVILKS